MKYKRILVIAGFFLFIVLGMTVVLVQAQEVTPDKWTSDSPLKPSDIADQSKWIKVRQRKCMNGGVPHFHFYLKATDEEAEIKALDVVLSVRGTLLSYSYFKDEQLYIFAADRTGKRHYNQVHPKAPRETYDGKIRKL